ncbi:FecR family protein [Pedobacter hartonius]|uniref:FecR family protein n=1 Tax=Pedobacter hartonius TaxID=425514 RepID=A0A1H4H8Z5_9SPHI|nr:FecR domain-containing protein [Pedobacter hartonius]SEB18175.1 FecR family protein [Pedobacter hartonius]
MDSNKIIELLARKMAGEATATELEQLNELMAGYPDTVYYEEILKEIWQTSAQNNEQLPLDELYLRHQFRYYVDFAAPAERPVSKTYDPFEKLLAGAAGILVILLICFAWWYITDGDGVKTRIVAGKGIRKKLMLPDGTLVWLNAGSQLSYSSDLNKKKIRRVYLTGEAFFDVSHRSNRPFIVRTDKISVKVLGTAFNIQAYPREHTAEATLLRGSIELSVNDRSGQKVILSPSEKFAFTTGRHSRSGKKDYVRNPRDIRMMIDHVVPVKIGQKEYIEETSWKDDRLVFKNESLEELKPRLERWFNVQIHLESDLPSKYRFTGVFTKESITEALTAMQLIKPFTFKLKAHDVIIY